MGGILYMHLLILTHNFPPEFGGAATMQYELAKFMVQSSHKVTVVTTHSLHHMITKKNNEQNSEEWMDGIHILRIKPPNWKRANFLIRVFQDVVVEFGFLLKAINIRQVDCIFVMSPPITLPILAWFLKILKKSKLFLNVQDIFPELLIALGAMKRNSWVFRFGQFLEKIAYLCPDHIGVHSPKNLRHVVECGIRENKVSLVPLWVDTNFIKPYSRINTFSVAHDLEKKFIVMYAGTIGYAMGAQTIPHVAKILSAEKDIQFLVVGNGSKLDEMKLEINKLKLENILVIPPQPREDLPEVLASADILLVLLKKEQTGNPNGYFQAVIPHKLLSDMASGRPIIASVELSSDTARLVQLANCGKIALPESPQSIADRIIEMKNDNDKLSNLGLHGRDFVCQYFNSDFQVNKMEKFLSAMLRQEEFSLGNPWNDQSQQNN
jgi:colanic acid biosynthesis glycosyl transferase WcaI